MRVDIGSMLQGQVQTELPDILPVSAEQNGMQTESDFTVLLGFMNSEENFQDVGMKFVSGVEKTDETADNIVEASVIEIPDDEHEFIMEESEDISPEKSVSEDSEDKKEDFYQQVFSSGLAADIQAVVYHNYSVGSLFYLLSVKFSISCGKCDKTCRNLFKSLCHGKLIVLYISGLVKGKHRCNTLRNCSCL